MFRQFMHDHPFQARMHAFKVIFVDAVVADQRIRESDDLACVGRIGQSFLVTCHPCVEYDLPDCILF
ncbi:hypothetical protein SDC9_92824 [bioreactor metagenome]|uniref:Uncharacterized protein n=1 Tax=bioreactor metagenome TaxID=1076179 RepID=A0A644ZZP6_9ZZZZ